MSAIATIPSIIARLITAKLLGLKNNKIYIFIFLYGVISYITVFSLCTILGLRYVRDYNTSISLLILLLLIISMIVIEGFILNKIFYLLSLPCYKISIVINLVGILILLWLYVIFSGGLF